MDRCIKMITLKKKCFCLFFPFAVFDHYTSQKKNLILEISKSFDEFYMINCSYLELGNAEIKIDIETIKKKVHKNCKVINPKSGDEFLNFCKDKDLIALCNIGRMWKYYRIHFLLKKVQAKVIYVHEIGNPQFRLYGGIKPFLIQYFTHRLPHKIVIFLSIMNIFPKVDLRFLTNKQNFSRAKNNFFFKVSKKYKYISLFYTREFELINSMSFDQSKNTQHEISEDKIVMIDTKINHHDTVKYYGGVSEETVIHCYNLLERFLKKMSSIFNKPVVVCIHPSENLDKIKKYLKDFEVVQHKTQENIYKSFLTFFYQSAAVTDAFMLKKRIIVLENKYMGKSWVASQNYWRDKAGIIKINIEKDFNIENKNLFLEKIDNTINSKKYNNIVENYLNSDNHNLGTKKIINVIKKKYFNN